MSLDIWCAAKIDVGNDELTETSLGETLNATGNLIPMWSKAGCYDALYKSDGKEVWEILPALEIALKDLIAKPEEYKLLNPKNGWGDYEGAVEFLDNLLYTFRRYPKAIVRVWG